MSYWFLLSLSSGLRSLSLLLSLMLSSPIPFVVIVVKRIKVIIIVIIDVSISITFPLFPCLIVIHDPIIIFWRRSFDTLLLQPASNRIDNREHPINANNLFFIVYYPFHPKVILDDHSLVFC